MFSFTLFLCWNFFYVSVCAFAIPTSFVFFLQVPIARVFLELSNFILPLLIFKMWFYCCNIYGAQVVHKKLCGEGFGIGEVLVILRDTWHASTCVANHVTRNVYDGLLWCTHGNDMYVQCLESFEVVINFMSIIHFFILLN